MSFNRQAFRTRLQVAIQQGHFSLREAAKESGVSASTLSRLLNGEMPDMETFATLTRWLQADVSVFFDHEQRVIEEDETSVWAMLCMALVELHMPADFVEALVKMVQIIRERQER